MSDDMAEWLRAQLDADERVAEAVPEGHWRAAGRDRHWARSNRLQRPSAERGVTL